MIYSGVATIWRVLNAAGVDIIVRCVTACDSAGGWKMNGMILELDFTPDENGFQYFEIRRHSKWFQYLPCEAEFFLHLRLTFIHCHHYDALSQNQ